MFLTYSPYFHYEGEKWDHVERQQPFLNENWFLYNQFVNMAVFVLQYLKELANLGMKTC